MSESPAAPPNEPFVLCALDDIPVPGSKGFCIGEGRNARELFLVRDESGVYAYLNRCPHTGSPLDWMPDQFLSIDRTEIQCATHDARFRITDGFCTSGPCAGDRLTPIPVAVNDGLVSCPAIISLQARD